MTQNVCRLGVVLLFSTLVACGPRKPIPEANQTYFWKVTTSDLSFGQCSDAPDFRAGITPIQIDANSYFVYKVSADGNTATSQACTSLNVSTCSTPSNAVTFQVAGSELTFAQENTELITSTKCNLVQSETWTFLDQGTAFSLDINNVLTLTDSQVDCDKVELNLKKRSPNMLGVVGCVVSFKLGGEFQ